MLATGNDELQQLPDLGKTILCWRCGKRHRVKYGETVHPDGTRVKSDDLAYFTCGESTVLCGIKGKEWRPRGK